MRAPRTLMLTGLLLLAGCGDDDPASRARVESGTTTSTSAPKQPAAPAVAAGTRVTVRGSAFGRMLWGPGRRAIYVFQRDARGRSRCYGDCATAWPPVYTRGQPRAGSGVRESLLGTIRRRDGRRQVIYAGKPLYYYAHEGPGEVRCHDVHLNGGFWWVVGPDGRRRP
jgi:predicted lipoprotein with Yx(FWY)xxD motif